MQKIRHLSGMMALLLFTGVVAFVFLFVFYLIIIAQKSSTVHDKNDTTEEFLQRKTIRDLNKQNADKNKNKK
jgi:uncharacterized membrane protein